MATVVATPEDELAADVMANTIAAFGLRHQG
jgi:hypothetical protein